MIRKYISNQFINWIIQNDLLSCSNREISKYLFKVSSIKVINLKE